MVLATPFVGSIVLMCILFFVQGSAQGFTDLGGTHVLLTMWKDFASAPLSCAHLGYGIGAFLLNIGIRPFILQTTNSPSNGTSVEQAENSANIVPPYAFVSLLALIIGFGHLFFYIRKRQTSRENVDVQQVNYSVVQTSDTRREENVDIRPEKTTTTLSSFSPLVCGRGSFHYGLISSFIYICYTFFIGGNDQTFSKFYFTYLKFDKFQISTGAASWAISLYWLSYSVSEEGRCHSTDSLSPFRSVG